MTSLQMQIELLESSANDAELIGCLACEPEARQRNRLIAKRLRDEARNRSDANFEASLLDQNHRL